MSNTNDNNNNNGNNNNGSYNNNNGYNNAYNNGYNYNNNARSNNFANNPYIANNSNNKSSIFSGNELLKGAVIGALATYVLTNPEIQTKIFKTFAKGAELVSGGIEEIKERYEDIKAEIEAKKS